MPKSKKVKNIDPGTPQTPPHYRSSWYLGVRPRPKRNQNDIFEKHIIFWSGLLDGRTFLYFPAGPSAISRRVLPLFPGGPFRYFPAGPSAISRRALPLFPGGRPRAGARGRAPAGAGGRPRAGARGRAGAPGRPMRRFQKIDFFKSQKEHFCEKTQK